MTCLTATSVMLSKLSAPTTTIRVRRRTSSRGRCWSWKTSTQWTWSMRAQHQVRSHLVQERAEGLQKGEWVPQSRAVGRHSATMMLEQHRRRPRLSSRRWTTAHKKSALELLKFGAPCVGDLAICFLVTVFGSQYPSWRRRVGRQLCCHVTRVKEERNSETTHTTQNNFQPVVGSDFALWRPC